MLLKNILKYEYFICQLVSYDLKIKYKGSFFGIIWSFLEPLSRFLVMVFVFSLLFVSSIENYPLFLFSGLVVWNFFEGCSQKNINRIVEYSNLVKKVNFPRELIIISGVISSTITFLLESIFVLVLVLIYGKFNFLTIPLYLPAFLALVVLNAGASFFLSSLNTVMRDVQFIWRVIVQTLLFATPIFYDSSVFPDWAKFLISLNPLTGIIKYVREVVVLNYPLSSVSVYSFLISVAFFLIGYKVFNHYAKEFAEVI